MNEKDDFDEYDLLNLPVEELLDRKKEVHAFKCQSFDYDYRLDFEFETTSSTYDEGIAEVAKKLAEENCPVDVHYERYYSITLPIKDEDGIWRNTTFNSRDEGVNYCHRYSTSYEIKKHPAYIARRAELEKEQKEKKEAEMMAEEKRKKAAELAIYEKVKKEMGL